MKKAKEQKEKRLEGETEKESMDKQIGERKLKD